jgi:hypothetical protein
VSGDSYALCAIATKALAIAEHGRHRWNWDREW